MAPAGGIRDPLGTCSSCSSGHASVAQLDVHLTGEEEVVGLTPTESATIFLGDLIMKYFLRSFCPFRWFKKGSVVSFWWMNVHRTG